jgi:hypothetical protein
MRFNNGSSRLSPVADLLQAMASLRDYNQSLQLLQGSLSNRPPTADVQARLDAGRRTRDFAWHALQSGRFVVDGPVAVGYSNSRSIRSCFPPYCRQRP